MEVSVLVLMSVLRRLKDGLLGCFLPDRFVWKCTVSSHVHNMLIPDLVD